ncbi:MAG TPA: molybdenum cofactor guanylyltransferase MobA [Stellaceae bacterium]|nr:molybdenum cofactor guanylyltransferase MobA [Stellaceae bacterium]
MRVVGVILAGGLSRRLGGGDKCLRLLAGRPILAHIIERLRPQVDALALNANGDPARFAGFHLPVVADSITGFAGPLAGILAGLDWAAGRSDITHVATAAADAPFLPLDLVHRLRRAREAEGSDLAGARSAGRAHPVFGLWPVALRDELRAAVSGGVRKVDQWTAHYRLAHVDFPDGPPDPFFNVNQLEDLIEAERLFAMDAQTMSGRGAAE